MTFFQKIWAKFLKMAGYKFHGLEDCTAEAIKQEFDAYKEIHEPSEEYLKAQEWNNKYTKGDIEYLGRTLKWDNPEDATRTTINHIEVDVRAFITKNDLIMKKIVNDYGLKKETDDETMLEIQKFVSAGRTYEKEVYSERDYGWLKVLTYVSDSSTAEINEDDPNSEGSQAVWYYSDEDHTRREMMINGKLIKFPKGYRALEYWQLPFETWASHIGDCEDGAILIAALAINAGIPSYRVKVAAGFVDTGTVSGGHAYCIYLASDDEWRIIDWCFYQDYSVPVLQKPFAKNGGFNNYYKDVWFTFNDEYSWDLGWSTLGISRIGDVQKKEELKPEGTD
jgi:hypothetical protein